MRINFLSISSVTRSRSEDRGEGGKKHGGKEDGGWRTTLLGVNCPGKSGIDLSVTSKCNFASEWSIDEVAVFV